MKKLLVLGLLIALGVNLNAQIIEFKDAKFKAKLLTSTTSNDVALGVGREPIRLDSNNDKEITIQEALRVEYLNVYSGQLTNIDEVKYFVNLKELNFSFNNVSDVDLSQNTKLELLYCSQNKLKALDFSGNINLNELNCQENLIESFNLSQNINLLSLQFSNNLVKMLDVSNSPKLQYLYCTNNLLVDLDVSSNKNMRDLYCDSNPLQTLNLKNGVKHRVNIDKCPNLKFVCVDQLDFEDIQSQIWDYNYDTELSTDCKNYLTTSDFDFNGQLNLYPNPTKDRLSIESKNGTTIQSIAIYNLQGQLVVSIPQVNQASFDVSNLPKGVYVVKVNTDKGATTTKLVKE